MTTPKRPATSTRQLAIYVTCGVLLGAVYAGANTLFDILDRRSPLVDTLAVVHGFVDRGVPLFAGALLGVAALYVKLRSELARAEATRADELRVRLQHVERDQAVWVVIASALHDVRNPLHALGLLIDELAEPDLDPEARPPLLEKARRHMGRVRDSLASLREFARGAGPAPGAVELDAVVNDVARDLLPLAERDGIQVTVDAPPLTVPGDAAFVRIIVENLLGNSLDVLRSRGGPGRVHIAVAQRDGEAWVEVQDDGPGLGEGAALFEPLASTKARGLGLGLSISRALARAMRGDLEAKGARAPIESDAAATRGEQGNAADGWSTTFALRLPISEAT